MKLSHLLAASLLLSVTPVSYRMIEANAINQPSVIASEASWGNVNNIHFTDNFSQFNSGIAKLTVGTPVEVSATISFSGDYAAIQQAVVSFENVDQGIQIDYNHTIYFDPDTKQARFKFTVTLTEPIPAGGSRLFTVKVSDNNPTDKNHLTPYSQRQTIIQGDDGGSTSSTDSSVNPSTDTSTEPSTDTSTEPSTDTSTEPSTDTSTEPSTDTSTEPSTDTSTKPSTDTSIDPSTDTSTEPSTDTSTDTSTEPSTDTSAKPSTDTSTESTTEPSSNTGENSNSSSRKDAKSSSMTTQQQSKNQSRPPRSSVNKSKKVSSQAKKSGYSLLPKTGESDTSLFMIAGGLISLLGAILLLKRTK
ncbi:LPXTG cell wall anchor domain-containing protein [Enterococcus devriesei]|uniref:LPXTG cell wall anchor domain-containing protein n=1 Tax=Enterococcus devriesei TaxID=319970 RepID=UPI00288F3B01|nr:LPXTG cell wall anchor domain-containing protein [Enterococcus devriesei]MDT2822643.1 LPXTG cell wall anchor domain-containing protein [Enterococcus devriesei]